MVELKIEYTRSYVADGYVLQTEVYGTPDPPSIANCFLIQRSSNSQSERLVRIADLPEMSKYSIVVPDVKRFRSPILGEAIADGSVVLGDFLSILPIPSLWTLMGYVGPFPFTSQIDAYDSATQSVTLSDAMLMYVEDVEWSIVSKPDINGRDGIADRLDPAGSDPYFITNNYYSMFPDIASARVKEDAIDAEAQGLVNSVLEYDTDFEGSNIETYIGI